MSQNKGIKLSSVIVAYDRFQKSPSVTVQLLDYATQRPIVEFQIPKSMFSKPWEELQTVIRFRARKDFNFILPKTWTFANKIVKQ